MAERQDDLTPEQRLRRAQAQKRDAAAHRPAVDSLFRRLRKHLDENHFAERFYAQLDATRRET
jgi:hypothetical protein